MKKRLLHIWIVVAILFIVSVTFESVKAQSVPANNNQQEVNLEAYNKCDKGWNETRQHPSENTFIDSNHTQHIGFYRPPRLSSNNGGNSGRNLHVTKANDKYNLQNFASLLLCYDRLFTHLEAESPRLHYVIALRRILC